LVLHPADDTVAGTGVVGLSGDLRLVHHQADQLETGTGDDGARKPHDFRRFVHGRATHADVAQHGCPPRGVRVDRHADARASRRGGDGIHRIQLRRVVDHQGDPTREVVVADEPLQRRAVDARVSEHDVVMLAREPERLGKREGEDAAVAPDREVASRTSRTRIDLLATRIGTPAERTTRSIALNRSASRSMAATGPDTAETAADRAVQNAAGSFQPGRDGGKAQEVQAHRFGLLRS
jgi:hypothetical protein